MDSKHTEASERDALAARFEEHRAHLRAVAYRMLGALAEADDAVQEAWLRVSSNPTQVENFGGWVTTIVARVCLNRLRARHAEPKEAVPTRLPDPVIEREHADDGRDPEQTVMLADSVGLALQIVLDTLPPAERLAFVLHDIFNLPFEEIAPMVGRSAASARQLASRGRRRIQGAELPAVDRDRVAQRRLVDAFFAAARGQDLAALLELLDADVVLRSDGGQSRREISVVLHGAKTIARRAIAFAPSPSAVVRPALINGCPGAVVLQDGRPISVMGFTATRGKISEIDTLADPERLADLDLSILD